jgi:hypothetical protein
MRLDPNAFNRFLNHIGQEVTWRRSFSCACLNAASGQPDPKHALCAGKGRIWDEPIKTVVGVASQATVAQWAKFGQWETGDMIVSVQESSPLYDAAQFDRVVMLNATDAFSQPLTRGAPTEVLKFALAKLNRVFWLNPADRNQIIEGAIPVVSTSGELSWTGGVGEPPPGTTYSITGEKFSEYFVFNNLSNDRGEHSGARLPRKIVLRRFDLFSR